MSSNPQATLIMPVFNGATTLPDALASLEAQHHQGLIAEIIFVEDGSTDASLECIQAFIASTAYRARVLTHDQAIGLAASYNEGITNARTPIIILMHQDIVLTAENSFSTLLAPLHDPNVVASYPVLLHPLDIWKAYNFWEKCLLSRFVGKKTPMLTGKFDAFRKDFLTSVGYFDADAFRTAGEDSDLKVKIELAGKAIKNAGIEVNHLQYIEQDFSFSKLVRKEAQIAEAQGVLLRRYGPRGLQAVLLTYFRQILLLGLLIPYLGWLCGVLIIIYSFIYTGAVYRYELANPRIIILPFVNIFLLFVALGASLRGFVTARQEL